LLYSFSDFVLDTERRELRCGCGSVDVEPQVFDLLEYLIRHRERVVSRDELIESVWSGRIVSDSALNTRINAVRSAIGDSGTHQHLIKTLPRKGVRFIGAVREEQELTEAIAANSFEREPAEPIDVYPATEGPPAQQAPGAETTSGSHPSASPPMMLTPPKSRRFFAPRAIAVAVVAVGALSFGLPTWSYFARSTQSERTKTNIDTAAKLTHIFERIRIISREDYEAARALRQWAVELNPHNPVALANLSFAIVTGVLNHWSADEVADLHVADLALQEALAMGPASMRVRGAQCQLLRGMRQFEAGIKECGEFAQSFPTSAFLHKEIGYDELMLGQLDGALAEFLEADRLEPDSQLRWSWEQGIGLVYLMEGQNEKAIEWLARAALEAPNAGNPAAFLASAYALAGREQEAREALAHHLKLWPNTTLKTFEPSIGRAEFNSKMQRVLEGLRLAGLPD